MNLILSTARNTVKATLPAQNAPPVPGYLLWNDANDVNGNNTNPANSTALSTWVDKSVGNNALQSTGADQPLFKTNIQNGKPGVLFNGSTTLMVGNVVSSNLIHTMFVAGSSLANAAYNFFSNGDTQTNGFAIGAYNPGTKEDGLRYFGAPGDKYDGPITVAPCRMTGSWDGTTSAFYLNGTSQSITNATAAPVTPTLYYVLGNVFLNNGSKLNGYIFEVIYYPFLLSTAQRQDVDSYLSVKWSI